MNTITLISLLGPSATAAATERPFIDHEVATPVAESRGVPFHPAQLREDLANVGDRERHG